MRVLRVAFLLALAAPPAAHAGGAAIVARDLPVGGSRSIAAVSAPIRFDLVGVHWRGRGRVLFRTHSVGGRWSAWHSGDADNRPDPGTSESRSRPGWRLGAPYWAGPSDRIQWRTEGDVRRLRAWFVWSPVERSPLRRVEIAGSPPIIPRAAWHADESIRRAPPAYASSVRMVVVHHTAGSNAYTAAQSAAIVRGIELYHVKGNGWNDIGYNFLVDRYGQVFEGRYGGITRNVIGAHAQGFNTGTSGISVIGNFSHQGLPAAAERSLVKLIAWRLDVAHVEPLSKLKFVSLGNPRFHAGVTVDLRAVSGHRDTGYTDCPGSGIYSQLDAIAAQAEQTGLPKLWAPVVTGKIGGRIRFSAQLSTSLSWTVTVTRKGVAVARASGRGTRVAWTWNSAGMPRGRYTWSMEAGPSVRPAAGIVGGSQIPSPITPPAPVVKELSVSPAIVSPNGDGFADSTTISYTLTEHASVTAEITDATGAPVAVLFQSQLESARTQSLPYAPDPLPDGRYTVTVTALADDGRTGSAHTTLVVDRVLSFVSAQPAVFSPNNDGVDDTIMFSFQLAGPALVTVEVVQNGVVLQTVFEGPLGAGPYTVTWDGMTPSGVVPDGHYDVVVSATDSIGTSSQSAGFDVLGGG